MENSNQRGFKLPKPVPLKQKLDNLASKFNTFDQEDSESMKQASTVLSKYL